MSSRFKLKLCPLLKKNKKHRNTKAKNRGTRNGSLCGKEHETKNREDSKNETHVHSKCSARESYIKKLEKATFSMNETSREQLKALQV